MKHYSLLIVLCLASFACSKEHKKKWRVTQSTFFLNRQLVLKNQDDFNKDIEPYDSTYSIYHQVYGEEHELPNNDGDTKQFTLEIVDTISSFDYWDEEIYNNLNCEVWQHYFNKDDGFYRIHKGHISGKKK